MGPTPTLGGHDGTSESVTGTSRPSSLVPVPAPWSQTDPGMPVILGPHENPDGNPATGPDPSGSLQT